MPKPLSRSPKRKHLGIVIAGLDPAIHLLRKEMDPRVKPAGDKSELHE
jgi:hypothetical protein